MQLLKSEEFGVIASNVELNFAKVQERKEKIVTQLHKGVQHLMKQGKIDVFEGIVYSYIYFLSDARDNFS